MGNFPNGGFQAILPPRAAALLDTLFHIGAISQDSYVEIVKGFMVNPERAMEVLEGTAYDHAQNIIAENPDLKLKWELKKALLAKGFTPEHADTYLKELEGASPRQLKNAMDSLSAIQGGAAEPAGSTSAAPVDPTAPKPASTPSTAPSAPSGEPSLPVDPAKAQFGGLADAPTASTAAKLPSASLNKLPQGMSLSKGGGPTPASIPALTDMDALHPLSLSPEVGAAVHTLEAGKPGLSPEVMQAIRGEASAAKLPSGFWQRPSAGSMARGGVGALGGYMLHEALTGGDGFTPGNIAQGIAGAGLMGLPFAEFTPGMSKGAQAAAVLKGIGPALKSMAVAELGAQGVNMGSRIVEDAALNYMMGKGGLAEALKALGGSTATGLGSLAVGASVAGLPTSLAGTAALFTNPVTAIPALVGLTGGAWSAHENAAARKQDMDFMATQKTMDRPMAERASSVNGSPLQKAMHEANQLLPGRRADELKGLSGDLLDAKRKEMEDAYAKAVYAIGQGMQDEGFSPAQMSAMMSRSTGGGGYGFIGGKDTVGATGRREISASTGPDGFQSNASYLGGDGLGGSFLDAVAALIGMK